MRLVTSVMALGAAAAWPLPPASGQWTPPFVDRTAQLGIESVHVDGATGALLLPEVIGPGGALFDYDNDGDLDLFFLPDSSTQ